jgi:hypothetical protein
MFAKEARDIFFELLRSSLNPTPLRILDVGCAYELLPLAYQFGSAVRYHGIDANTEEIEALKRQPHPFSVELLAAMVDLDPSHPMAESFAVARDEIHLDPRLSTFALDGARES